LLGVFLLLSITAKTGRTGSALRTHARIERTKHKAYHTGRGIRADGWSVHGVPQRRASGADCASRSAKVKSNKSKRCVVVGGQAKAVVDIAAIAVASSPDVKSRQTCAV